MKNLFKILSIAALFSACGTNTNVNELEAKRDSLLQVNFENEKEILKLEEQIIKADGELSPEDLKIKKQIIEQKNKLADIQHKITKLQKSLSVKTSEGRMLSVEVKEMLGEEFNHFFLVYGNVEADNYGMISPEMGGKVESIRVKEGQFVKKGTLLLTLNTSAVRNQIKGVKSSLELASTAYEKQKNLWDQKIGSEIQYLQAKSNKEALEAQLETLESQLVMAQLHAPYDGTVNKIYPKKGEMAGPTMPVMEFVNLSKMTVRANVSEKYIDLVKKGQNVELSFSALPDYKIITPIVKVSKVINPKSRTFEIELKIDNKDERIKPNMVSSIMINDYSAHDAFVIPSLTIKKDITGSFVYIVVENDGKSIVQKRQIETGYSYEDKSMITKGLKLGDKVVVKGYSLVSNGIPVKVN